MSLLLASSKYGAYTNEWWPYAWGDGMVPATIRYLRYRKYGWNQQTFKEVGEVTFFNYYAGVNELIKFTENKKYTLAFFKGTDSLVRDTLDKSTDYVRMNTSKCPIENYIKSKTTMTGDFLVYQNLASEKVVVLIDDAYDMTTSNQEKFKKIFLSTFPLLFPWFYQEKLDDIEKELYRQCSLENVEPLANYINSLPQDFIDNVNSFDMQNKIEKYFKYSYDRTKADLEREVANTKSTINRYYEDLANQYKYLETNVAKLKAFETQGEGDPSELIQFFRDNQKVITLSEDSNETNISYDVVSDLEYFDGDYFEEMYKNEKTFIHRYDKKWIKFLYDVFVTRKYKILMSCSWKLSGNAVVTPRRGQRTSSFNARHSIPNPHIYFYGCLGQNAQALNEYAKKGNWELAMLQSVAATKNINLYDTTVTKTFIEAFDEWMNIDCVTNNETGEILTLEKAIQEANNG